MCLDSPPNKILAELVLRYPLLKSCEGSVYEAFAMMKSSFKQGGKLLIAGNGGSAADAEHIAGELLKSFLIKRPVCESLRISLEENFGADGRELASKLEGSLPALSLVSNPGISTAFANDVDPALAFAQLVSGHGRPGDVFLGISTSGNSENIIKATMTAKAIGMGTIGLTGQNQCRLSGLCDITIHAPHSETYIIQEYHLPIYHALCAMLEAEFFEGVAR